MFIPLFGAKISRGHLNVGVIVAVTVQVHDMLINAAHKGVEGCVGVSECR